MSGKEYCKKCGKQKLSNALMVRLVLYGDQDTHYYGQRFCLCKDQDCDKIEKQFLKLNKNAKKEDLLWRADGRMEWLCEHRVGHTVYAPDGYFVHGCCGFGGKLCCGQLLRIKKN